MPDDPATIMVRIHGCDWGRTIVQLRDSALCPARATHRLWRHTASGKRVFQLCDRHYELATGTKPPPSGLIWDGSPDSDSERARLPLRLMDRAEFRMVCVFAVTAVRASIEVDRIRVEGLAYGLTTAEVMEVIGVWITQTPAPVSFDRIREAVRARADHTDWRPPHGR